MTIYSEYQTRHQELDRLEKLRERNYHTCGASPCLAIKDGIPTLRCGKCGRFIADTELVKRRSLTRQYKDGETLPLIIANRVERKLGGKYMESKELTTMSQEKMLARINQAKFPQELKKEERELLATAARTYGFDPIMGELTIFQGRPYVSIDGRYRKARDTGKLDGVKTRPASKEEREAWSIPIEDYFFKAEVFVKGCAYPFEGWGRVRAKERNDKGEYKPVDTNPQRMAEKRAEAQALRKGFSIPLPSLEDIGFEEEPAFEVKVVKPVQLSEDTEDSLKAWAGSSKPQQAAGKGIETTGTTNRTDQAVDMPEKQWPHLATMGDLMHRANTEYEIRITDIYSDLGVTGVKEIKLEPDDAWMIIAQKRNLKPR